MPQVDIKAVSASTLELTQAISLLLPQLSSSACNFTEDDLRQIVKAPSTSLLVARSKGTFNGMLTLVVFRIPTGVRAIIEDVVVDEHHRGQGIAEALTQEALARAHAAGARTVDLTSRPSREAANRLYQKLGFERRHSNVYRFSFEDPA
jgi:ribosomal protein S18 acetylase RimI-like enzyme